MPNNSFQVTSDYSPTGDQPDAITALVKGFSGGREAMTLEGVTGSGKTFTMAHVIEQLGLPTLVISHNKTLAAQLYAELKGFFKSNAVEYFVSYYDYYQPEAYIPQTDTYIEKDASINEEIERLRLSATDSLINRKDVVIVASVSCIYGLGSPDDYKAMTVKVEQGTQADRDAILEKLVDIQYTRNDVEPMPGTFRVRGDTLDIFPSYARHGIRVEFFGDEVDRITRTDPVSGNIQATLPSTLISPARHFVMPYSKLESAIGAIMQEMENQVKVFEGENKLLEAQRIQMRTRYDMEMMREIGFCQGIENYSRHLSGRKEGETPDTLLDYFQGNFLTIIDESHVTLPQVRAMYNGDRARKMSLVEHGFRLPSALDNRPMNFEEFTKKSGQTLYVSATPGPYEKEHGGEPVLQVIRPTGIVDPPVEIRPLGNQIDDLIEEVRTRAEQGERVLVTTLTKRISEDLTEYLLNLGLRVKYLHSEIDAIERVDILRGLRKAEFDCLVGINLLREGLDLPEVSLVAILDADKEGFLRSETSLVQTAGRAARHVEGKVILYADKVTASMQRLLDITKERRERQLAYNEEHNITPQSIKKEIQEQLIIENRSRDVERRVIKEGGEDIDVHTAVETLEQEMMEAAESLEYERAAMLRDQIFELKGKKGKHRGTLDLKPDRKPRQYKAAQKKMKGSKNR